MHHPLVSIIVPVYNSSKYLDECINSIISQSFTDFEVLLVDDGSTDNSYEICNNYSSHDTRIKLYYKGNGGVSSARNFAINKVKGTYITFIDSDDFIKESCLKNMVDNINDNVDLIQSGLIFFDNTTRHILRSEILPEHNMLSRSIPSECFIIATLPLITSPVSKLYRASIIKDNNIFFNESLSYGEDRDFNLRYIQNIRTAKSISDCGYLYRKEISNSLSCDNDYIKLLDIDLTYWINLQRFFTDNNCDSITTEKYLANRLFNFYNDRFVQIAHTNDCYSKLNNIIRDYISRPEYDWLKSVSHLIECNRLIVKIYQSGIAHIITSYLKIVL